MKIGKGSCNGTFGELVQGQLGDCLFLITLPIPVLRSEAVFIPDSSASNIEGSGSKVKALKAAKLLFHQLGLQNGGRIEIRSNIPEGKGMASSSADIVATLKAIADGFSISLSNEMISSIAVQVEPTDGVMYGGTVVYDHIHGELVERLGTMPPFTLVGIDFGGTIDTIEFNQIKKTYSKQDQVQLKEAYHLSKKGFREKNISYICKAATISARINQKILPIPAFEQLEKVAQQVQGGVVVAHSGTVAGILIENNLANVQKVITYLLKEFPSLRILGPYLA